MEAKMRVYISCDMEGISGVVAPEHVTSKEDEYKRFRRLMTREVNAAVEGALEGGATEIIVNDAHGSMRNILIEELNPAARLITGSPKPLGMMQGIDEDFDAAFFIGYHARAGTFHSILDHTYSGRVVYRVLLNGVEVGETGLNAALAGAFGVPVALVTGDRMVVEEAKALLGDVETVAVKESFGRFAARCLVPQEAHRLIREAAAKALSRKSRPFRLEPPVTLRVAFINSAHADMAELIPGSRRLDARTVEFTDEDYATVYRVFRAMVLLASM